MFRKTLSIAVLIVLSLSVADFSISESQAQSGRDRSDRGQQSERGGRRGGWGGWGGRGGDFRGRGGFGGGDFGGRGNWRGRGRENRKQSPEEQKKRRKQFSDYYLTRIDSLDTNKNGRLDPNEQNGEFKKLVSHFGMDPKRSTSISGLKSRIKSSDLTKMNSRGWNRGSSEKEEESEYGIPGFSGSTESDGDGLPGFGADEEEPATILGFGDSEHPILQDRRPLEVRFSKEAIEEARRTMKSYDRNKSGVLEPSEIKLIPWRRPGWEESDLDKNGFLTEVEMMHRSDLRFKSRSKYRSGRRSERSDSGRSTKNADKKKSSSKKSSRKKSSRKKVKKKSKYQRQKEDIKWVQGVFARYDKDKNGSWSRLEFGKIRMKPGNNGTFKSCDKNGDGKITLKEVMPLYLDDVDEDDSMPGDVETNTPKVTWAPLIKELDEAKKLPSSYRYKDKNKNNQIEMHEFTDSWTTAKLNEFKKKDKSGDGILTIDELSTSSRRRSKSRSSEKKVSKKVQIYRSRD